MKENQIPAGGTDRLPLVGSGAIQEFQLLNTNTYHGGKTIAIGGAGRLPLVGHERSKIQSERRPQRRVASLPPPGSFFNEKMLGDRHEFPANCAGNSCQSPFCETITSDSDRGRCCPRSYSSSRPFPSSWPVPSGPNRLRLDRKS